MTTVPILILSALAILLVAVLALAAAFNRKAAGLRTRLLSAAAPRDISASLPARLRDFARRADATPDDLAHCVTFRQQAEIQLKRGAAWQPVKAVQTMAIGAPGFLWLAEQPMGLIPKFRVIDGFADGAGLLQVQLLGVVPVVRATGIDIDRAEAMRYLAELPWAPDAILGNPHLVWRMVDDDWAEATLMSAPDAAVRFRFDAQGDIVEMRAANRPARDAAGNPVTYDWQGFFRDYRMLGPRRIPTEIEVGYIHPDGYHAYFQGRITDYSAVH